MKEGISKFPKEHILTLLSIYHSFLYKTINFILKTPCQDSKFFSKLETLITDEDMMITHMTVNEMFNNLNNSKDECKNIIAELSLHKEIYQDDYDKLKTAIAELELTDILDKVGLERGRK